VWSRCRLLTATLSRLHLTREFGAPVYERIDAPVTPTQKELLEAVTQAELDADTLAGEKIRSILTDAPGNSSPLGGIKVITENGWFAARPSGTEPVYKLYAESFRSIEHLRQIQEEAQALVAEIFAGAQRGGAVT
jgi:phosphoglucomutase